MPTPKITIPADGEGRQINGQTVYTKTAWGDAWTEQPGVVCTSATWTASPTIPTASFYYRYGVGSINNPYQVWNKFTLPIYGYVRVVFNVFDLSVPTDDPGYETTLEWIGLAVSKEDMPEGTEQTFATVERESGTQTFFAVGFEYLLERAYIVSARAKEEGVAAENLLFCPPFNPRGNPNATSATQANDEFVASKVFFIPARSTTTPSETPVHWTTTDICQYLCAWATPKSNTDALVIPFEFDDEDSVMPTWERPQLDLDGQRVFVALQSLVQRQRGLGFRLKVQPRTLDTDIVKVIPFTVRDATAPAGSLGTWAANPNLIDLDLRYVPGVSIKDDGHSRFDRVRVVGGKVIYCFTAPQYTDQIADGWTSSQESRYSAGVSGHADYAGWSDEKQKILDSLALAGGDVKDVFSLYRLNDRIPPQLQHFPPLDDLASAGTGVSPEMRYWFYRPVMPIVTLNVGVDYTVADTKFEWDEPQESPMPFAVTDIGGTDMAFDMRFGGLGNAEQNDADAQKMAFAVNVVSTNNPREFALHINGTLPHLVGFGGPAAITRDFGDAPGVEIEKVTLAVEGDRRTEVVQSKTVTVDAMREMLIDLGDDFRVVVLCKDTVIGIKMETATAGPASSYRTITATKIIRDDRPQLESIASAALAWYGKDRRAIRWTQKVPISNLYVGQMVSELQVTDSTTLAVNTVITSIAMNVTISERGQSPVTQWTYETQFAELDFV